MPILMFAMSHLMKHAQNLNGFILPNSYIQLPCIKQQAINLTCQRYINSVLPCFEKITR